MRSLRKFRDRLAFIRWYLTEWRPLAGAEDPPPADPPAADPPAADPPPADPPAADPPRTFNQADVDRIVGERLARANKDKPSDDELAELRDKAKKHDDAEAANATELETAQKERDDAKEAAERATETANKTLRRAAIVTAAAEEGVDPETVHALLSERGFKVSHDSKDHEVTIGDDGQVTGAKDAVKAIVAVKELTVGGRQTPGPGDGGARGGGGGEGDINAQIAEAESKGDWDTVNRLNAQKLGQVTTPK